MSIRFLLLFVVIGFAGCATKEFPANTSNSAVLVIPKVHHNESLEQWVRRYIVVISKEDENGNMVDVEKVGLASDSSSFEVVGLEPGEYELSRMEWVGTSGWRAHSAMGEGYPLGIPVELKDGKATILPYRFAMTQESNGGGVTVWFNINLLEAGEKQALMNEVKIAPRSGQWSFD
ncbi:hypothetical protein [Hahella sp. CCB-MM4]|uniref:hypothetical protein n=1 Tax=Hahella sp. (strain CCB-MM4) TaxID=1926491 RepID=UPI00143D34F0|nr:hypothetical protein [Hahella sp. CCB-MM4]